MPDEWRWCCGAAVTGCASYVAEPHLQLHGTHWRTQLGAAHHPAADALQQQQHKIGQGQGGSGCRSEEGVAVNKTQPGREHPSDEKENKAPKSHAARFCSMMLAGDTAAWCTLYTPATTHCAALCCAALPADCSTRPCNNPVASYTAHLWVDQQPLQRQPGAAQEHLLLAGHGVAAAQAARQCCRHRL